MSNEPTAQAPAPPRLHWSIKAVALVVLAALVVHYAIIWLYLTPDNPVKLATWKHVNGYVHPMFAQNWQLFAPNPISQDELVHVKVRWREDGKQKVWETDWIDLTTPIFEGIHRTRIGPYSKLARPHTGVKESLSFTDDVAQAMRDRARESARERWGERIQSVPARDTARRRALFRQFVAQMDTIGRLTPSEQLQRRTGREMLYRVASAGAREAVAGRGVPVAINVRFVHHQYPRFSERDDPDAKGVTKYGRPLGWERPADVALR